MNSISGLIILGASMWILNFLFGLIQIKNFNKNYIEMRRLGRVAIGRKKGYFQAGTVVMMLIDEEGKILLSKKMQGLTVLARVKEFTGLEGKNIEDITEDDLKTYNKSMKAAILDAVNNYKTFGGGEAVEGAVNN
ncbi:transcriptional regulator GutM [Fonticella tunisiensis]|uniref:DNA-binding transcriptional regulator of glucitol operon n=1 Tax=Fonticella tunisiensis TaxID=1096341 RepID=A0A4R7KD79_9CLOT|nr:transcriptional regulator GutM [Fonticella tunisiensis]TDT51915.1 DNA-binding transcriptional regulator of glucitol operon [Fonticella tunisiensis]